MHKRITAFFAGLVFCLSLISGCADQTDAPDGDAGQTPPYTIKLNSLVQIFDSPTYDGCYVDCVGEDGVYTIVEEQTDSEDHRWGKLKSGIGWVDLSALAQETPVRGGLANEVIVQKAQHIIVIDDAPESQYIVFQATELLSDVCLTSFSLGANGELAETTLHTAGQLTTEQLLVAQVVFYGDFTLYGLAFTDQKGQPRSFALSISGRNGAPILQEISS